MTGTENRPGKKARSLSRKRIQEKREWWWWWGGLHKNTLQPFKVCQFPSTLPSMSPFGSDSSLSLWPCIYMSLFPPLGLPTVTIHPCMALSGSPPPLLLPRWGTAPSFSSGSSLNKRDQWVFRKQSCIWCGCKETLSPETPDVPWLLQCVCRNPPLALSPLGLMSLNTASRAFGQRRQGKRDSSQGAPSIILTGLFVCVNSFLTSEIFRPSGLALG